MSQHTNHAPNYADDPNICLTCEQEREGQQSDPLDALIAAATAVIARWEHGDLAGAVNDLAAALAPYNSDDDDDEQGLHDEADARGWARA